MITIETIQARLEPMKRCSRRQLFRYFKTLNIKPVGARQRPRLYPDDAAKRIEEHLFGTRIHTLPELRAIKAKAQAARRGK